MLEYKPPRVPNTSKFEVKMYAELERKECSKCKKAKEKKEFSARSARLSGKASWCKSCLNEWRRNKKAKNPKPFQDYEFKRGLRRHYGMTVEQYQQMLSDQVGCCACCGKHESEFKRRLHVDHDHNSGHIRALLCTECNPGMGYFCHSVERLEMAIRYLKKFKN
jgi:hypothetical protein